MRQQLSRLRRPDRRWLLFVAVAGVVFLLLAGAGAQAEYQGSDLFANAVPEGRVAGSEMDKPDLPPGNYKLDYFVDTKNENWGPVPDTPRLKAIGAEILHVLASLCWDLTRLLATFVISLVSWAFGFDLISGNGSREGAVEPVGNAIVRVRENLVDDDWLIVALLIAGLWAIYTGLVKRKYALTAGGLAASLLLAVVGFAFVTQDQWIVKKVSQGTNELSASLLAGFTEGDPSQGGTARREVSDDLFATLVVRPYTVLEFGGLEHCTNADGKPVKCASGQAARRIDHLPARYRPDGKSRSTRPGQGGYVDYFVRQKPGSDEREKVYEAIRDGEPSKTFGRERSQGLPLVVDEHDRPGVDIQQEAGASDRLVMAMFMFFGELGAFLLIGLLALGVVISQAVALLLLAFAPVALAAALIPDWGHRLFLGWLTKLGLALAAEVGLALVLSVLLVVGSALIDATAGLGWLLAFALQMFFFWAVFLNRNRLLAMLSGGGGGGSRWRALPADTGRRVERATAGVGRRVERTTTRTAKGGARLGARGVGAAGRSAMGRWRGGRAERQTMGRDQTRKDAHAYLQEQTQRKLRDHGDEASRLKRIGKLEKDLAAVDRGLHRLRPRGDRVPTPEQRGEAERLHGERGRLRGELDRLQGERNASRVEHDLRGRELREIERRENAGRAPFSEAQYREAEQELAARQRRDLQRNGGSGGNGADPHGPSSRPSREIHVPPPHDEGQQPPPRRPPRDDDEGSR